MTSSAVVGSARERLGPAGVWLAVLRAAPVDQERLAATWPWPSAS
jgi:phosphoserine aminotransferase